MLRYMLLVAAMLVSSAFTRADVVRVVTLELDGELSETPGPLDWLLGESSLTLRGTIDGLRAVSEREDVGGVLIRVKDAELTRAQISEIGAAMKAVRASGKKVAVFAEAYETGSLVLASYADHAIVQRGGPVQLTGVYMEEMFLADTLAWAGIKADMIQIGDYKGANEQMSRSGPSEAWARNLGQLLDSLYAQTRAPILDGRKMSELELDAAMEQLWLGDGEIATKTRVIDGQADLPELGTYLAGPMGGTVEWAGKIGETESKLTMDPSNPFAMLQMLSREPPRAATEPSIAIVHINGTIIDGESTSDSMFGSSSSGSRTIRNALEDALSDDNVKGVVIRINSPGGSATASEVMWQGIQRVSAKKPVWISVGDMAASGGYYCAVGGQKIYVNPTSIVGSIGVVGGRMSMQGLYDKFHVRIVPHTRGPASNMFRSTHPWSDEEIGRVRTAMARTYELFTRRVSQGRPGIDLSKTAEGRLFVGAKAVELGMADNVGGLHECVADLAAHVGLVGDDFGVIDLPAPKSIGEMVQEAMKGFGMTTPAIEQSAMVAAIRAVVGERAWRSIGPSLDAAAQLRREPVLLTMPVILVEP